MAYLEVVMDDSSETETGDALFEGERFIQHDEMVRVTRNVRSVGFISKPGETQELKKCIEGSVLDHLKKTPGFSGLMILHAQKESRNLWVLTFWETENEAANTCWEEWPAARKLLSPLIDVSTKVQTFEATFPSPRRVTTSGALSRAASIC